MGGRGASSQSGKSGAGYEKYMAEWRPYEKISKKQASVIYRAFKNGDIDASKDQMDMMYYRFVSDSAQRSTDMYATNLATSLRTVINALFANDGEAANAAYQHFLNNYYRHFKDTMFPDTRRRK